MLFITHELPLLRHVSSSIAVMYAGEFVEMGTTEQIIFDGRQPYTKALMGSMLSAEPGQRSQESRSPSRARRPTWLMPISGAASPSVVPACGPTARTTEQELRIVQGPRGEVPVCRMRPDLSSRRGT